MQIPRQTERTNRAPRPARWLYLAVIAIAGAALYAPSLGNDILYDDEVIISQNRFISDWHNIPRVLSRDYFELSGEYSFRPVATLSYFVSYLLFGQDFRAFRLLSVLLHVIAAWLVFALSVRLLKRREAAFLAGLLFVVHPVASEPVLQISFNEELLCTVFVLLSFLAYTAPADGMPREKGRAFLGISLVAYLFALFSKETAVVLPLLLALHGILENRRWTGRDVRAYLLFVFVTLLYLWIRFFVMRYGKESGVGYIGGDFLSNAYTMTKAFLVYLRLIVFPVGLSLEHPVAVEQSIASAPVAIAFAGTFGLGVLLFIAYQRSRVVFFGLAWLIITLFPVMNLIPFLKNGVFVSERYLYLSLAGFSLLLGYGIHRAFLGAKLRILVTGGIIIAYGIIGLDRGREWGNALLLWSATLQHAPSSAEAHVRLGAALAARSNYAEAADEYRRALNLDPGNARAHNNLGNVYFQQRDYVQAVQCYRAAIDNKPDFAEALGNLGSGYLMLGDHEQAVSSYRKGLVIRPGLAELYLNLGTAYEQTRRFDKAAEAFRNYLELRPEDRSIRARLNSLQGR